MASSRVNIIHEWKRDERLADESPNNRRDSMYPAKHQNITNIKHPIITWYNKLSVEDNLWKAWVCFHEYEILFIYLNAAAEIDLNTWGMIVTLTIQTRVISPLLGAENLRKNRQVHHIALYSQLQIWSNTPINISRLQQQIWEVKCQCDSI